MNTLAQNQKVVKGLSIAAIVISALAIIFSLVMVFIASATLTYVNETVEQYSSLSSYYSSYYYGYVDPDELAAMSFAATAMVALAVFAVISGGFQLFVSIIRTRRSSRRSSCLRSSQLLQAWSWAAS